MLSQRLRKEHIFETLAMATSISNGCVFASFSVLLTWSAISKGNTALILRCDMESVVRELLFIVWPGESKNSILSDSITQTNIMHAGLLMGGVTTYLRQGRNQRYYILVFMGYAFMVPIGVLLSVQVAITLRSSFPCLNKLRKIYEAFSVWNWDSWKCNLEQTIASIRAAHFHPALVTPMPLLCKPKRNTGSRLPDVGVAFCRNRRLCLPCLFFRPRGWFLPWVKGVYSACMQVIGWVPDQSWGEKKDELQKRKSELTTLSCDPSDRFSEYRNHFAVRRCFSIRSRDRPG